MEWLQFIPDWMNAHRTAVVWIIATPLILMCLMVVGAVIGFALCEPHRRETWDRPLPQKEPKS